MPIRARYDDSLIKDVAAGIVGGLAGAWVMTRFEGLLQTLAEGEQDVQEARRQKEPGEPAARYVFGAVLGAVYGALGGRLPGVGPMSYGTGLWLAADETALPVLGLPGKPAEHPVAAHAKALASHWIYGAALDRAGRLCRRLLV